MKLLSIRPGPGRSYVVLTQVRVFFIFKARVHWVGLPNRYTGKVKWKNANTNQPANSIISLWLSTRLTEYLTANRRKRSYEISYREG